MLKSQLDDLDFRWMNPPGRETFEDNALVITTRENTDFWQRTHYGFQRDDGHFLYAELRDGFCLTASLKFEGQVQYDQCGLMARVDAENWLKCSIEYENPNQSRLGSVVTNLGYSDWATQDVSSDVHQVTYRLQRRGSDFLIEYSVSGKEFSQMRIAHLHRAEETIMAGVYACSPKRAGFTCALTDLVLTESTWSREA